MKILSSFDLDLVTGGAYPLGTLDSKPGSGSSSSGNNSQLLSTLQGIQGSLSDLGKNQNQGLFGGSNGLMFMTMALAMSRRNDTVVYANNGGGCYGGGCHH